MSKDNESVLRKGINMRGVTRVHIFTLIGCFTVGGFFILLSYLNSDSQVSEADRRIASQVSNVQLRGVDRNGQAVGAIDFLQMLRNQGQPINAQLAKFERSWDISYVPMLLEVAYFLPRPARAQVMSLIQAKTGNKFGTDFDKWYQWIWQQDFPPHPEYGKFKLNLYSRIDPRFAEYFVDTEDAKIRLDEIRWGGVRRDGIPPLNDPKMVAADKAEYLADSDVVFGIELNGDARAYPKRILAWHEMFKDTIGGESVCGVY